MITCLLRQRPPPGQKFILTLTQQQNVSQACLCLQQRGHLFHNAVQQRERLVNLIVVEQIAGLRKSCQRIILAASILHQKTLDCRLFLTPLLYRQAIVLKGNQIRLRIGLLSHELPGERS